MTTKQRIVEYVRNKQYGGVEWTWEGWIEDYIRDVAGTRGDTVARRCRELVRDGFLEKDFSSPTNRYKIKLQEVPKPKVEPIEPRVPTNGFVKLF